MKQILFFMFFFVFPFFSLTAQTGAIKYRWTHLSTEYGDTEMPFKGKIQTGCIVADLNKDGSDEFIIVEGTDNPSVVMYVHTEGRKWEKHEIEKRSIQAGEAGALSDIDEDGDLDIVVAGGESEQIWWWENPFPNWNPSRPWKRNYIKKSGVSMHSDIAFGDFDGDGKEECAFWNQGKNCLFIAEKPENIKRTDDWDLLKIFDYNTDGHMLQRTTEPVTEKGVNYHEGMCTADIDLDGITDLVAGGMWFKFSNGEYIENDIDKSYIATRICAGQLVAGGRPEILMVTGMGEGPLVMYEYNGGVWVPEILYRNARHAHSLQIVDFDKDGDFDILMAEMRMKDIRDPKLFILLNNGDKSFERMDISLAFGSHNTGIGDIDGDGDYDIVGKPYAWDTPRIDIWLNEGKK
ncbi:MAG: VCBS repeat-containing protein [Prolixibacteraceae bacterium]|nr:VCBS repeat-containing protein [Prolixibacteraceae bacterium]